MSKIVINIALKVVDYKEVEINLCLFRCYESGKVERQIMRTNRYGKKGDFCRCDNNKPRYNKKTDRYDIQVGVNGKFYFLHRIVYYAFNPGFDFHNPKIQIDHINRDSMDNKISNLREATHAQNQRNQKTHTKNKLGLKNIYDRKTHWVVQINKDGRTVVNRCFNKTLYTLDDVILFRNDKLLEYHKEFANLD